VAIIGGALLLRRLIGPNAAVDRLEQVVGMLVAVGLATAVSATVGTVSMLAGGVVAGSEAIELWRTRWLGDAAGGLVILPLALAWTHRRFSIARGVWSREGAGLIAVVASLSVVAVSSGEPILYTVFPALIWAAIRFGPRGATLSVAITAAVAIVLTAYGVGVFFEQPLGQRTLITQLYIAVAAVTSLVLSAVVSERERSSRELTEARRTEGARAVAERQRIARDLHDSVSPALFSTELHARAAEKALAREGGSPSGRVGQSLGAISDLTRSAHGEMRAVIFALGDPVPDGLVAALVRHTSGVPTAGEPTIDVQGPGPRLALSEPVEGQLFAIAREALANARQHACASVAHVRVAIQRGDVVVEVQDDGHGFNPAVDHRGHFGLDSMRSRAAEIGGRITIKSAPRSGTLVRIRVPAQTESS
jgi:signal transduction histidine kinase